MMPVVLVLHLACIAAAVVFALINRAIYHRLLALSLVTSMITVEIVLYAVWTGQSMFLDIALAFVLLSYMDVQFFAVYLRRKGDL